MGARRVAVLAGPQQSAKTTLAQCFLEKLGGGTVHRLDEADLLRAYPGPQLVRKDYLSTSSKALSRRSCTSSSLAQRRR
jgi:hypothetical protein